ncbi:MAG: transposase, partial [Halobacteria archaeon]
KNLVLDNYAIHRSRRVREFAEGEEGRRVALVFLPTYSPNLNITEPFWKFVKAGAASNRFHGSVERLREAVNRFFRGCERSKIPAFRFPTGIWGDFFGAA